MDFTRASVSSDLPFHSVNIRDFTLTLLGPFVNREFLQTMVERRQAARSGSSKQRLQELAQKISSRYEGIPEHNPSQYFLLEESAMMQHHENGIVDQDGGPANSVIQVSMLPAPNATITFSQPNSRKTLTMSEAEEAIQDQRGKMTRFMMHEKRRMLDGEGPPVNASKTRLFGKLKQKAAMAAAAAGEDEDDDDIMGDVAFRNRKGSGKRARKELLDSLGDAGLKVDADGVLGGANDSEFGRGVRFGRFQNSNDSKAAEKSSGGDEDGAMGGGAKGGTGTAQSFDGLAMADDFYQRDVGAEYEELDYDANEQFDDDDVDLGESEVVVDGGGFAEDDDDDDLDENELDGEAPTGAEGLASIAGFRLMLAKARGEVTPEQAEAAVAQAAQANANKFDADKASEPVDHLAQIIMAAEKSAQAAKQKASAAASADGTTSTEIQEKKKEAPSLPSAEHTGVEVDENGQRLITLAAVRREIWLHHGAMSLKRVTKIFGVKKGSKERQAKFKEVVKELCTMRNDPVNGRMLVLKQHYSQMG